MILGGPHPNPVIVIYQEYSRTPIESLSSLIVTVTGLGGVHLHDNVLGLEKKIPMYRNPMSAMPGTS